MQIVHIIVANNVSVKNFMGMRGSKSSCHELYDIHHYLFSMKENFLFYEKKRHIKMKDVWSIMIISECESVLMLVKVVNIIECPVHDSFRYKCWGAEPLSHQPGLDEALKWQFKLYPYCHRHLFLASPPPPATSSCSSKILIRQNSLSSCLN